MMTEGIGMIFHDGFPWLIWLLLSVALFLVLRLVIGNYNSGEERKSALDILRERYAKGEIDQQEFQQKLRDLSG